MPSDKVKVGILGVRHVRGKEFDDAVFVNKIVRGFLAANGLSMRDVTIITGGSKGIETIVVAWAEANGITVKKIPPCIVGYGQKAFDLRNAQVVDESDKLLFFWDGIVVSIPAAISAAMFKGKPVLVHHV